MDAFRRFRSRKKSKGQADAFTSFAEAETNFAPKLNTSAEQTLDTKKPEVTQPRSALPSNVQAQKTSNVRRPSSSREVRKPLLTALPRPSVNVSRPGTAESLQTALNRAAESISTQNGPGLVSSPLSRSSARPTRYIDILAISRAGQPHDRAYNEEIAERNLDGSVPAKSARDSVRYVPTSKYQEEVASRNAHQIAAQRASSLRRSIDAEQSRNIVRSASTQSGSYPDRGTNALVDYQHHGRQSSSRPREAEFHLPAIPQERSSDDFRHEQTNDQQIRQEEEDLERAKARWKSNRRHKKPNTDKPLPASPRRAEPLRDSGISYTQDSPYKSLDKYGTYVSIDTQIDKRRHRVPPSNQLATPDLLRIPSNPQKPSFVTTTPSSTQKESSEGVRRPSHSGSIPYRRVKVGNRTVMDLTGDDDNEEHSITSSMQTPVLENAQAGVFQKAMPTIVDHASPPRGSPVEQNLAVPNARWSHGFEFDESEPVLDLDQLARRSQNMLQQAEEASYPSQSPRRPPNAEQSASTRPLAFSRIQTVASSSQRSTITFSNVATLNSTSPRSSQELDSSKKANDAETTKLLERTSTLNVPQPNEGTNSRLSADIASLIQIVAEMKPEASTKQNTVGVEKFKSAQTGASKGKSVKDSKVSPERAERRRKRAEEMAAIILAAKSSIPAGPLDHEPQPGVKTRDFAATKVEKPVVKRVEALTEKKVALVVPSLPIIKESASSKSSSSERKGRLSKSTSKVSFNDTPTTIRGPSSKSPRRGDRKSSKKKEKSKPRSGSKTRSKSKFDEEAYLKKHAEANAALLRLQQSLQESFDNDTDATETSIATIERALSPAVSVATTTPAAQSKASEAAMAMIAAATAASDAISRPLHSKTSSDLGRGMRPEKPAGPVRAITDNSIPLFHTAVTKQAAPVQSLLLRLDSINKPPPSPGEVSLSAFPLPTPRALSPETTSNPPAYVKDPAVPTARSGSVGSRASAASAFSVPSTMVPIRAGSLPQNRMPPPNPPVPSTKISSIDSMIPPTNTSSFVPASG